MSSVPDRSLSMGNLVANGSTGWFPVMDIMGADSGVITILSDGTWGGSSVTLEIAADTAGTKGGSSDQVMTSAAPHINGLAISPSAHIRLTMSARDTDDLNFYGL